MRLISGRDNGDGRARGQPAGPAFPRLFWMCGAWAARNPNQAGGPNIAGRAALLDGNKACAVQRPGRCSGTSALEKRVDLLLEFLDRGLALDLLAIDEEGRRRIHFKNLAGVFLVGGDLVEQRLVLQAGLDLLLCETGLLADS